MAFLISSLMMATVACGRGDAASCGTAHGGLLAPSDFSSCDVSSSSPDVSSSRRGTAAACGGVAAASRGGGASASRGRKAAASCYGGAARGLRLLVAGLRLLIPPRAAEAPQDIIGRKKSIFENLLTF